MDKFIQSISKLVLEDVSTSAEDVFERLPRSHRQFERIYLRDEIYDGEHPQRVEGLVVKPAVPPRVYRLFYPEKRMVGWADYSGRDGKLKVRRKGSWVEPKSSIPDDRRNEMEQFVDTLKEDFEVEEKVLDIDKRCDIMSSHDEGTAQEIDHGRLQRPPQSYEPRGVDSSSDGGIWRRPF